MSSPRLRLGFAGTPVFARVCLEALIASGRSPCLVICQPDRPVGRGQRLQAPPVKQAAEQHQIPVLQPERLRADAAVAALAAAQLDLLVVVAYGQLLSETVLQTPRLGCINVHASLLPRWRGAAPIERAIEAGDSETGVAVMQVEQRLDSGPVFLREAWPIRPDHTGGSLHDELAVLGGQALVATLEGLERGCLQAEPQEEARANYAQKLKKLEARIDWTQPAADIERRIRAFNPRLMAHAELLGIDLRIARARCDAEPASALRPGEVLTLPPARLLVGTGTTPLELLEVQPAGKRKMPAADFLRGQAGAVARMQPE